MWYEEIIIEKKTSWASKCFNIDDQSLTKIKKWAVLYKEVKDKSIFKENDAICNSNK